MIKNILLILIAVPLLLSCKPEEVEVPEEEVYWKLHEDFQFDLKMQLNSFADEHKIMFLNNKYLSILDIDKEKTEEIDLGGRLNNNLYKYPLNSQIAVVEQNNRITFYPIENPLMGQFYLGLPNYDPNFNGFDKISPGECFSITENNVVLIPYYSNSGDYKILLVHLEIKDPYGYNQFEIDTLKTEIFEFENLGRTNYILPFNNSFYLSFKDNIVKISEPGEIEISPTLSPTQIFTANNTFYSFSWLDKNKIFYSTDGTEWSETDIDSQLDHTSHYYYKISKSELVGTIKDKMYYLRFYDNAHKFLVKEINNKGLEGNKITSVCKFQDQVYVTTLSGVFYKEYDDFLKFKNE